MSERWEAKTCEVLQGEAASGSAEALSELMLRLMPEIGRKAASYRLPGLDREDLVQEGALGVMSAVRHYDPSRGEFYPFALRCAQTAIISSARRALSGRQKPLSHYEPIEENEVLSTDPSHEPERLLAAREATEEMRGWIAEVLSPFERQVLFYYLAGHSYPEIASLLSSHSKAVDNALQRVRRKLRRFYSVHPVSA